MEVDEETDSRKTLEMRKRNIIKDMRKLEGVNSLENMTRCRTCLKHSRVWRTSWYRALQIRASSAKGMNRPDWRLRSCELKWRSRAEVCARSPERGGVGFGDTSIASRRRSQAATHRREFEQSFAKRAAQAMQQLFVHPRRTELGNWRAAQARKAS